MGVGGFVLPGMLLSISFSWEKLAKKGSCSSSFKKGKGWKSHSMDDLFLQVCLMLIAIKTYILFS